MAVGNSIRDTLSGQASLLSDLTAQAIEPTLQRLGLTFSTFELLASVKTAGKRAARDAHREPGEYEFQMLYGIRTDLQRELARAVARRASSCDMGTSSPSGATRTAWT